jgi:hypothetical protein
LPLVWASDVTGAALKVTVAVVFPVEAALLTLKALFGVALSL